MSTIAFACPACRADLEAPDDLAGEQIACPSCQKTVAVPRPAPRPVPHPRMPTPAKRLAGGFRIAMTQLFAGIMVLATMALALYGLGHLTQATEGVGILCAAAICGILARLLQAGANHADLIRRLP